MQVSRWQDSRWKHERTTQVPHIITCLPLINSPNTPYCRDEPSYLLYKKQTQYSFTVTQTNNKAKTIEKATPSSLYPAIYQAGFCVLSLFLEGCKTFTRNSLITVILLSTKENKLQQHTVLSEISLSKVKIMKDGQKYTPGYTAHQDFLSFQAGRLWAQRGLP